MDVAAVVIIFNTDDKIIIKIHLNEMAWAIVPTSCEETVKYTQ
jgi:hypothetical protein